MKKLAAILFLTLFLFNIIGYRLVFYFVQQENDITLETSLDKAEYNESELITIKVPISLPYQTNWKDFERVDGEINFEGKIYKYVKRKVEDGQLVLMCRPHVIKSVHGASLSIYQRSSILVAQSFGRFRPAALSAFATENILSLKPFEACKLLCAIPQLTANSMSISFIRKLLQLT